jgi:hypothetical protein
MSSLRPQQSNCIGGAGNLNDQLVISFVRQLDHDCSLWIVNIPKNSFAVLVEGSGRDDPGHARAGSLDAMPPPLCDAWIFTAAADVGQRNLKPALERPQLVPALHVETGCAINDRDFHHQCVSLSRLFGVFHFLPTVDLRHSTWPLCGNPNSNSKTASRPGKLACVSVRRRNPATRPRAPRSRR